MIHLDNDHLNIVKVILQKYVSYAKIIAFGSRVKGNMTPQSDLDLCIVSKKPMSSYEMASLREAFSNSDLPFRVDIVEWLGISAEFRKVIQEDFEVFMLQ